jgi:heme-degrading monooxygenase HmoA
MICCSGLVDATIGLSVSLWTMTPVSLDDRVHWSVLMKEFEVMFVNIVHFPKIKEGKDSEFRQWFVDSNRAYAEHRGFIRRILLQPQDGGNYVAIVEHESQETFMAMHTSPTQAALRPRVVPLLEENPRPAFYNVVIE